MVRAVARVLRGLFTNSSPVRAVINNVSVYLWLGVVTHMAGVFDGRSRAEAPRLPVGKTQVSALTMLQGSGLVAGDAARRVVGCRPRWNAADGDADRHERAAGAVAYCAPVSSFWRAGLRWTAVGIDLTVLSVFGGALASGSGLGCRRLQRITWAALPCCWNAAFAWATA